MIIPKMRSGLISNVDLLETVAETLHGQLGPELAHAAVVLLVTDCSSGAQMMMVRFRNGREARLAKLARPPP